MRSTDYISKGTAVARLYKAREYLLMDKDCRYRPGMVNLSWVFLCEHVWCGISRYALNTRSDFCVVLKMCICLQGTSYSESLKFPGTKRGVRLR